MVSNRLSSGYALTQYLNNPNLIITQATVSNGTFELHFNRPVAAIMGFSTKATTFYMSALKLHAVNTSNLAYPFQIHDKALNFQYFLPSTVIQNNTSKTTFLQSSAQHLITLVLSALY